MGLYDDMAQYMGLRLITIDRYLIFSYPSLLVMDADGLCFPFLVGVLGEQSLDQGLPRVLFNGRRR
jgi:hypothetical protein